jgi:hypothetical protein
VYRLYSLCAIYGLEFTTVLRWYGIELEELLIDAAKLAIDHTRILEFNASEGVQVELPTDIDERLDLSQTSYLGRHIRRWGRVPLALLNLVEPRRQRYGFIGTEDWSMYPILWPGSFVQIDETRRRVARDGWAHECERPIYFVEHRDGFRCGWCTHSGSLLIVQPHSSSQNPPQVFRYPGEAEVVGQVVGVAMRLDLGKRRHKHS